MEIRKNMTNLEISKLLQAVAASYKIKDKKKNLFRIIAYQRAADAVEHLSSEAKDLWDDNKLQDVAGIGESIADHLGEIFKSGKSKHFKKVMKGLPPAMFELMIIPGIGAKTAYKLATELNIKGKHAIGQLEKQIKKGKVEKLVGMGKDTQVAIKKSIKEVRRRKERMLLPFAAHIADEIVSWMKKEKSVLEVDSLGSLRRKASTVGDIDIAVSTNDPVKVIDHFTSYPKKTRVLEKGERTASIIIPGNRQVDLMVQEPKAYGATLQHFTGSKHHNIALREIAIKKGLSLSEYGVKKNKKLEKFDSEESFYQKLGMQWIPPELREDIGEIKAAKEDKLPNLIELKDIKADLQIHSDFDIETSHDLGESSMKDIVKKASELGYEYLAFTEHNPSKSKHNQKQIVDLLKRKRDQVEQINYSLNKQKRSGVKKVFSSLEIDILPSGKLPVEDKGLELLDFALVSIHSSFRQSRSDMTKRILSALSHPKVKVFAHPSARKLNKREGVEIEWEKVFEFCVKNNKWLEINASPMRIDLPADLVKDAIRAGVKLTLGTDSHHVDGLDNMVYGISVARRGWAEKKDIVNTLSLKEFEILIK